MGSGLMRVLKIHGRMEIMGAKWVYDYANDTGVEEKDMPAGSPRHAASERARAELMKRSLQTPEVQP